MTDTHVVDDKAAKDAAIKVDADQRHAAAGAPLTPAPMFGTAAPVTAKDKLRAFEDKNLGKDVPRIDGKIERGHGSPFRAMKPEQHLQYAALERLVDAEQKLADAVAALDTAKLHLETAKTEAANAAKATQVVAPKPGV